MKTDAEYATEKEIFKTELLNGVFDLDTLPNEGENYQNIEERDFLAFSEHLNSACSKKLSVETFGK